MAPKSKASKSDDASAQGDGGGAPQGTQEELLLQALRLSHQHQAGRMARLNLRSS